MMRARLESSAPGAGAGGRRQVPFRPLLLRRHFGMARLACQSYSCDGQDKNPGKIKKDKGV
jgi:hypothetical protein